MKNNYILEEIRAFLRKNHPDLMMAAFTDEEAREQLTEIVQKKYRKALPTDEELLGVVREIVGLGVVEELMKIEGLTDISFNGTDLIINTNCGKYAHDCDENAEDYVKNLVQKFAAAAAKELTSTSPILDAEFKNLRINAVHKSISPFGTTMALRYSKPQTVLNEENFCEFAPQSVLPLLKAMVKTRSNIVISGETGSGKTELQKFLVGFIPFSQKIALIEDTTDSHIKEIYPKKDIHSWVSTESTPFTSLIKAALRNNPTWIILSETRGKEAYEMLQAVLSGHHIVTTLHAVDCRAIPKRFVNMIKIGYQVDENSVLDDIYNYFQFGVHIEKAEIQGKTVRYLSEIVEYRCDKTATTIFKQPRKGSQFFAEIGHLSEDFKQKLEKYEIKLKWGEKI